MLYLMRQINAIFELIPLEKMGLKYPFLIHKNQKEILERSYPI